MFKTNEDLTIECTRGDAGVLTVSALAGENNYVFQPDDVVRFSVCEKKNYSNVVLQKDVTVTEATELVEIQLDSDETKIGEGINKPTEYWYTVELNPNSYCQTIIGHTQDGARVFMLYPEAVAQEG
jgi:hypothetical protein